jgi:hypothetical protein
MTSETEAIIYRNGTIISQSPNKLFALVEVDETSYVARKAPEKHLNKGTSVTVRFSTRDNPQIV